MAKNTNKKTDSVVPSKTTTFASVAPKKAILSEEFPPEAVSNDATSSAALGEGVQQEEMLEPACLDGVAPPIAKNMSMTPADATENPPLLSLDALAHQHRVCTWQQAALLRLMGWEEDKVVTDEEYLHALTMVTHRNIGSGRLGSERMV